MQAISRRFRRLQAPRSEFERSVYDASRDVFLEHAQVLQAAAHDLVAAAMSGTLEISAEQAEAALARASFTRSIRDRATRSLDADLDLLDRQDTLVRAEIRKFLDVRLAAVNPATSASSEEVAS